MRSRPQVKAARAGFSVEAPVGARVPLDGAPEVVGPLRVGGLRRLLGVEAGSGEVSVHEPGATLFAVTAATVGKPT